MKTIFRTFLILFSIFCMAGCHLLEKPKVVDEVPTVKSTDILFLAMDQGESEIFRLLVPELQRRNLSVSIFTLGQADTFFADMEEATPIATLATFPANLSDDRAAQLAQDAVTKIVGGIRPTVVVTGMSHAIEAQLSNHFRGNGSTIVAVYDRFSLISQTPAILAWLKTTTGVDDVLLPGHYQAIDAGNLAAFQSSYIGISGHPVLEQWDILFLVTDAVQKKHDLGLDPKRPVILFTGGQEPEYQQWLTLFLRSMAERPDIQVLIAPDPRTDGQLEREKVQSLKLKNVRVMDGNTGTAELATVADLVVTHKSITGFQAAWQGLPVLFIAAKGYTNILTDAGLASRASSWQQILNTVHGSIDRIREPKEASFRKLGVPEQSLQRITDHLQLTVQKVVGVDAPRMDNLRGEAQSQ